VIRFAAVTKVYRTLLGRAVPAVADLSLDVAPGEVLGIAGPNGAGKSTLIALLLGFLRPTAGHVLVHGLPPRRYVERHGVGYMAELVHVPRRWRAGEALVRYAVLAGLSRGEARRAASRASERFGLEEHRRKRITALSKGTLQRLALAQALFGEPRVLVLDEPTHGLDPVWTRRFRDVVDELRAPDRTILVASHNLDELERLADRVAILDRGRLQRVVDVRGGAAGGVDLREGGARRFRLSVAVGESAVRLAFPDARPVAPGELEVRAESLAALNAGLARAITGGALLTAVAPDRSPLEAHFHEAVGRERVEER
jgi:ABC-type multidrug transport system ATPase subunit